MNLKSIEITSAKFIKKLSRHLGEDGYVLTDIVFYKGDENKAHVEIRAKKLCADTDKPLWWVCALPLDISENYMQPSQGDFNERPGNI